MDSGDTDNLATAADSEQAVLTTRVNHVHLRQRLGIESDREAKIFGQGLKFFHLENWYSFHSFIRFSLRLLGLHGIGKRNARKLVVQKNQFCLTNLPSEFNHYTILHISDLHLDMHQDIPGVLIQAIDNLEYDICVLTGDFRAQTYGDYSRALAAMAEVQPHIRKPTYAILGNHDSIRMVPGLESLGIKVLLNEAIVLERGAEKIFLAGIDDPHYYRTDNIEKAFSHIPQEAISILLSHSPEIYKHAAHVHCKVFLCGHTHGGQICLPGGKAVILNANCPRNFCSGNWQFHGMYGYTSRGSGVSMVDVRFNCPAEVTLHTLVCGTGSTTA